MTRSLYQVLNCRSSWFSYVQLSDEAVSKIMFWKQNARSLNGRSAWPTDNKPSKIVYSERVVQYTRTESGRLFGKDDPSSGSRVVLFAEVKKQEIVF